VTAEQTNGDKEGMMVHRLVLAGSLVMLLTTSSFAVRAPDGSHCRKNRECASRYCQGGI